MTVNPPTYCKSVVRSIDPDRKPSMTLPISHGGVKSMKPVMINKMTATRYDDLCSLRNQLNCLNKRMRVPPLL